MRNLIETKWSNITTLSQQNSVRHLCLCRIFRSSQYCRVGLFPSSQVNTIMNYFLALRKYHANNSRIVDHPNYGSCCDYDFSLLQLQNGFNLPSLSNVEPACLPSIATPSNVDVNNLLTLYAKNNII